MDLLQIILSVGVATWLQFAGFGGPIQGAENTQSPTETSANAPLCRFGVNVHGGKSIDTYDTAPLRLSWYIDYGASPTPPRPNGIEYTPVIRLHQVGGDGYGYTPNGPDLAQTITANPGADWIIGNEPDRRFFQDDLLPGIYAKAYHELYTIIKQKDSQARVFAGAIVQPTPLRLQYLDAVLSSYLQEYHQALPTDGWAIHNFILNEASCNVYPAEQCWGADIPPGDNATDGMRILVRDNDRLDLFKQQITRFRQWMLSRGYRNKPLYLSEYGVLMPDIFEPPDDFPPSRVNKFMNETFDYLLNTTDAATGDPNDGNRLVQRLAWYSTDDKSFNGYLFEKSAPNKAPTLSLMGQNFVSYTTNLKEEVDLAPVQISVNPPAPLASRGNVTFTVQAQLANSGNTLAGQSFKVRFYAGDPAQGGKQIGQDQTVTLAGCGKTGTASVLWPNITPGSYQIYVQADPAGQVTETNEQNNLRSQRVFFPTQRVFLPTVSRPLFLQ